MQQKTYTALSENPTKTAKTSLDHSCVKALENATKTAKTSLDQSCVKALFTEACK